MCVEPLPTTPIGSHAAKVGALFRGQAHGNMREVSDPVPGFLKRLPTHGVSE
jgi:hypothetical protein